MIGGKYAMAKRRIEQCRFTFPAQALPCSGSTGIISAVPTKTVETAPRGRCATDLFNPVAEQIYNRKYDFTVTFFSTTRLLIIR